MFVSPHNKYPSHKLRSSYVPERAAQVRTEHIISSHVLNCISNPYSNTLEPDRLQHDRPAACVITQQNSSATFASLRFHYRKDNFEAPFFFLSLWNCISLELRNIKLREFGNVSLHQCSTVIFIYTLFLSGQMGNSGNLKKSMLVLNREELDRNEFSVHFRSSEDQF
jgi:hypothetical protein